MMYRGHNSINIHMLVLEFFGIMVAGVYYRCTHHTLDRVFSYV